MTVTRARRCQEKKCRFHASLSRGLRTLTHHAVRLPTLFLFPRTSLSLVASPDVSHLEQGAKVYNRVRVFHLRLYSHRGTLRQ